MKSTFAKTVQKEQKCGLNVLDLPHISIQLRNKILSWFFLVVVLASSLTNYYTQKNSDFDYSEFEATFIQKGAFDVYYSNKKKSHKTSPTFPTALSEYFFHNPELSLNSLHKVVSPSFTKAYRDYCILHRVLRL